MTRIAVYPGSFDPPTRGHEDLVRRSLGFADRLIIADATNVGKQPLFSVEERLDMGRRIRDVRPTGYPQKRRAMILSAPSSRRSLDCDNCSRPLRRDKTRRRMRRTSLDRQR